MRTLPQGVVRGSLAGGRAMKNKRITLAILAARLLLPGTLLPAESTVFP
jgi:hypothetical protein